MYARAWMTLGPVIASDTVGPQGWGFALASMAVGMLVGTLVLLRVSWDHPLRAGMSGALMIAIPVAVLGLSPNLTVLLLAALVGGIGFDLFSITWGPRCRSMSLRTGFPGVLVRHARLVRGHPGGAGRRRYRGGVLSIPVRSLLPPRPGTSSSAPPPCSPRRCGGLRHRTDIAKAAAANVAHDVPGTH